MVQVSSQVCSFSWHTLEAPQTKNQIKDSTPKALSGEKWKEMWWVHVVQKIPWKLLAT